MTLTCPRFSRQNSIKVSGVNLPGKDRLRIARRHHFHVTVLVYGDIAGASSLALGQVYSAGRHNGRLSIMRVEGHIPGAAWGPVDGSGPIDQCEVGADSVELLSGVRDGASQGQLELGAGGPACPQLLPRERAQEAALIVPAGASDRGCLIARARYVFLLAFCSVRHWTENSGSNGENRAWVRLRGRSWNCYAGGWVGKSTMKLTTNNKNTKKHGGRHMLMKMNE